MPGCLAAARFLVKSLVMIEPDPVDFQQVGGNFRQPFAEHDLPDRAGLDPDIHNLQECLPIGVALIHWEVLGVEPMDLAGDGLIHIPDALGRQDVAQLDISVFAEVSDLRLGDRVRPATSSFLMSVVISFYFDF